MYAAEALNPITQRLNRMEELWDYFRALPQAQICRWIIKSDEKKMIDAFLETTYLDSNDIADFFLPFYTPFNQLEEYSAQLIQELDNAIKADKEALAQKGIHINWKSKQPVEEEEMNPGNFLQQLGLFADQVPEAEIIVAVLLPTTTTRKYGKWLNELVKLGIPDNLRLLVVEQVGEEVLSKAADKFPEQIITHILNLDMPDAMRQLASAGNPADPGVKFRKAFLELSQAAANKNISEIHRLEISPLTIARELGWMPMEIAVHSLVATAYIGLNQLPNALQRYDQAYAIAKKVHASGEKVGLTLAIQCLFHKGSVFIALKQFPEASSAFALAADHAQEANDFFQVMEAKRMQGYCLEKCSELEEAFVIEKEALVAAEKLDENIRVNSTLPYLGKALLDLAYQMGHKTQFLELEDKMNALAGPNWQSKLLTSKAAVV